MHSCRWTLAASPPAIAAAVRTGAVAGDVAGWQRFMGQLDEYIRARDVFFRTKAVANENVWTGDLAMLAPFRFHEEALSGVISRTFAPLAGLAGFATILALLVARSTRQWHQ
jgi:hypothetical protein